MADKEPLGHVEVPYPTVEQALHSAQHLALAAIGRDPLPTGELVAHGWIGLGGALATIFPLEGPMAANAKNVYASLSPEQQQQLQELASMKAGGMTDTSKLDWKALAKTIIAIALQLLAAVVLMLTLTASASAQSKAPKPPKAPPLTKETMHPEFKGCACNIGGECVCGNACQCAGKAVPAIALPEFVKPTTSPYVLAWKNGWTQHLKYKGTAKEWHHPQVGYCSEAVADSYCHPQPQVAYQPPMYYQPIQYQPMKFMGGFGGSCGSGG